MARTRRRRRPDPAPLRVPASVLLLPLVGVWAVALAVILAVPDLHSGDRSWWPWCAVAGIALGVLGWIYVRRGRGNASSA